VVKEVETLLGAGWGDEVGREVGEETLEGAGWEA